MLKPAAGFTLVETVVVMAVLGLLFVIVFVGSTELQDRARFDTSIDQVIQDISYARNFATTQVNELGPGNSTNGVIAGSGIELDNNHSTKDFPLVEVESLYANQDSSGNMILSTIDDSWPPSSPVSLACPSSQHPDDPRECVEDFMHLPDTDISVQGTTHQMIYFVNTPLGLRISHDSGPAWQSVSGACSTSGGPPLLINLVDTEGFSATIQVDMTTGEAKRL